MNRGLREHSADIAAPAARAKCAAHFYLHCIYLLFWPKLLRETPIFWTTMLFPLAFIVKNQVGDTMRTYKIYLPLFLLFSLLPFIQPSFADDFKLKKLNTHYVPQPEGPEVAIPRTNIKFGVYPYLLNADWETSRLGFRIGEERFYFVQSTEYNLGSDINFGFSKNYLVVDAWGYGAGRNRLMFLFKYDRNSVQLLDVVGSADLASGQLLDFISDSNRDINCITNCAPGQITIQILGEENSPKIRLHIIKHNIYERYDIFLKISEDRLRFDLDQSSYKPLFEGLKLQQKFKTDAYYIYGFFAGQLGLEDIEKALAGDKNKYSRIMGLLEKHKELDRAFHVINDEKFSLIPYTLPRR